MAEWEHKPQEGAWPVQDRVGKLAAETAEKMKVFNETVRPIEEPKEFDETPQPGLRFIPHDHTVIFFDVRRARIGPMPQVSGVQFMPMEPLLGESLADVVKIVGGQEKRWTRPS